MKIFLFFITLVFFSCNSKPDKTKALTQDIDQSKTPDFDVALRFINDYAEYCSQENHKENESNWIQHNTLLTDAFKTRYQNILDSARKQDPDLGLGFDPVFDAQDFPDKGFVMLKTDKSTGYITVVGKDWKKFELVLRVVKKNNLSLVDGAGIINIPKEKRATR